MRAPQPREANFRRGTIMGLTAAEAFMLICFILLLLLGLWRESTREAMDFYAQFTPNQRVAAEIYQTDLESLGHNMRELKSFQDLLAEAGGEEKLKDALRVLQDYPDIPIIEILDRIRLVDEATLKTIAEAAAKLPKDVQRQLADLSTSEQFAAIVQLTHSSPQGVVESVKQLREYELSGLSPEQVKRLAFEAVDAGAMADELGEFTEIGLDPAEIQYLVQSVEQLRKAQVTSGKNIADAIRVRAGDLIEQMGGKILDNGDVVFPESVLFDPGKDIIRQEFDAVLSRFCVPWLEALQEFNASLRNIQIEGHASSEWNSAAPTVAFRNNLDLSQQRAAKVYKRCLDFSAGSPLEGWAQSRLAAVGYSSSRPVMDSAGKEDRSLSRRVVFALDIKSVDDLLVEQLIDQPSNGSAAGESPVEAGAMSASAIGQISGLPTGQDYEAEGYRALRGVISRVIDGDTIVVGKERIRLEGLHAPERTEEAGIRAKRFVDKNYHGADVECWISDKHTYNRDVGVCFANGTDIAGAIVSAGLGRDCPAFSSGRYTALETAEVGRLLQLPAYCH